MTTSSPYSVYVLRCADGSLYTGIAKDVDKRLMAHNGGRNGAKILRGKGPLELVFQRVAGDRGLATRMEYRIKKLPRREKINLIRDASLFDGLLAELRHQ